MALLRSLAVAPPLRSRRIGHALWAHARDHPLARGIRRLYLMTTTAEGLFARWGFHRVARDQVAEVVINTSDFNTICPITTVVMTLDAVAGIGVGDRAPAGAATTVGVPGDHLKP
jgi:amino-acid N-acetyltransferase